MAVVSAGEDGEAFGWGFALPRDGHPAARAWDKPAKHSKTCLSLGLLYLRVNSGAALIWIKRSKDLSWLFLNSCGWNILGDLPSFFLLVVGWLMICPQIVAPVGYGCWGTACTQSFTHVKVPVGFDSAWVKPGLPPCLAEGLKAKPESQLHQAPRMGSANRQRGEGVLTGINPLIP